MKILIVCSKKFYPEIKDIKKKLEKRGHEISLPNSYEDPLAEDNAMCTPEEYDGADDYRLFYRGEKLKSIEQDKLYFPDLSHA